ncbi:MAG: hypothetical protein EOP06_25035, partial [Proteobacteria bacterium]
MRKMLRKYEDPEKSLALYSGLAERVLEEQVVIPASHSTIFAPAEETKEFNQILFYDQISYPLPGTVADRPGNSVCKSCIKFNLGQPKYINKNIDINDTMAMERILADYIVEV